MVSPSADGGVSRGQMMGNAVRYEEPELDLQCEQGLAAEAPLSQAEVVEIWRLRKLIAEQASRASCAIAQGEELTRFRKHAWLATARSAQVLGNSIAMGQTLATRRLYNLLVLLVQRVYATLSPAERAHVLECGMPEIRMRTVDLLRNLGLANRVRETVIEAVERLYELDLRWEELVEVEADTAAQVAGSDAPQGYVTATVKPGERPSSGRKVREHRIGRYRLLEHIVVPGKTSGDGSKLPEGFVELRLGVEALRLIVNPDPYVNIDMRCILALSKQASVAVYELCARYEWRGRTPAMTLDSLVQYLGLRGRYAGWSELKRKVLLGCFEELDSTPYCPFNANAVAEERVCRPDGHKALFVWFEVKRKLRAQHTGHAPQLAAAVLDGLRKAEVTDEEIAQLRDRFAPDAIAEALNRMTARNQRPGIEPVRAPMRYLITVLEESCGPGNPGGASGRGAQDPAQVGVREAPARLDASVIARETAKIASLQVEQEAQERNERFREALEGRSDLLQSLRPQFEASPLNDLVRQALAGGWECPSRLLRAAFAKWVRETHPQLFEQLAPVGQ
jgi:hypothetical protein